MINNSVIDINLNCLNNNHQENIEFYCETCKDIPMCKECIPFHNCHSIKLYDIDKQDQLITDFSSSIKEYQNEVVFLNEELSKLQNQFNETQINSDNTIKLIEEEFKQQHKILEIKRLNLIKEIETYQDENNHQFIIQKSKIENKIQIINQSINRLFIDSLDQQQLLNSIQEKRYIEINKFNYKINEINKELPPFFEVIQPFNHADLKINNINDIPIIIDQDQQTQFKLKDFINNTYSIENKRKLKVLNNNSYIVLQNSELNKLVNNYNCYILLPDNATQSNNNNILLCLDNKFIKNNYNNNEILEQFNIMILHHPIKPNDSSTPLLDKFSRSKYSSSIKLKDISILTSVHYIYIKGDNILLISDIINNNFKNITIKLNNNYNNNINNKTTTQEEGNDEEDPNILSEEELSTFYKAEGNEYFKHGIFFDAIESYTKAILIKPSHLLYSNRSISYYNYGLFKESLQDALESVKIYSKWVKGYYMAGRALEKLDRNEDAIKYYRNGLLIEPENQAITEALKLFI